MEILESNKTTIVVKAAMSMVSSQVRQPKVVRTGVVSATIKSQSSTTSKIK